MSTIVTEFLPRINEQVQLANIIVLSFIFEYPVNKMKISFLTIFPNRSQFIKDGVKVKGNNNLLKKIATNCQNDVYLSQTYRANIYDECEMCVFI